MTAPSTGPSLPTDGITGRLTGLVKALRSHGLRIGPGETVDAAAALEALGLADRERAREGLAAALLHRESQRAVFDPVFDLYFPAGVGVPVRGDGDRDALRERLVAALAADDQALLARLAGEAVDGFGAYGSFGQGGDGWSSYQTLSRVRPETLLARVLAALRAESAAEPGTERPAFTDRLLADEVRRRIEGFRERVRTEARRRVAERRGTEEIARRAVTTTADRVDFLLAGRAQLDELRRAVHPLARKLATRLAARRRRAAHGSIDLRRTLRGSLSTGGVPMRPVLRRRRPARPELVLLCDVSGSVAGFANFTMLLVQALHDQFSKVRVFAFVNRVDEVTDLVAHGNADPAGLGARILGEATVTGWHGSSDYGTSLGEFAERYVDAVGPRSTVLVLGDARTNMSDPNLPALRNIAERSRRVYWLNPEARTQWSTGDSAAYAYAELVEMYECRNARQLSTLITRLLPV
ncbi:MULTISPECIES: VWA domain-containing protein [unclassified Streptomyces]|uniref:VWA domain-containing protein n=1 Tax=unclassified Streptomyces TaxID=2593676 RepID=UPI00136EDBD9|nr:VWA domain-containing protein [Streptomyces sp. SID335]MYZ15003.1 VWA domain-containing protein [Streptomyces sp. SID337]NEB45954.1 VWA domain-containing protein [Streptomyces sp. SID339]